jgi:hypothetical protein
MALKKKAKSIQRERKAKPSTLEQNTNIGEGAQQVVKVIVQQPPLPKPKKRASKAKVDPKKSAAIEDLRSALQSYDDEQNKADQMGIAIPKELGVSPLKAGTIKNIDDILAFIQVIREKTQQIKELESRKAAAPAPAAAPVQKPNMFLTPPAAPLRSGLFPSFIPIAGSTIQPAPAPQIQPSAPITPSTPGLVPPVPQSEIDRELAEIERILNIAKSPDELAFEDSVTQIKTNIETIRDNARSMYTRDKRLSDNRVREFKQAYENERQKLIAAYVKMPKESQDKFDEVKASMENLINSFEDKLGEYERASQDPGGDPVPPPIPPPSPDVENAKNIVVSYITQKPKPNNYGTKISDAFKILGASEAQLQVVQAGKTKNDRRQKAADLYNELVGGRTPIPPPYVPPPKPSADKVIAKSRLIQFVNDEDIEWSMSLLRDLKTIDAPLTVQNAVSETSSDDDRRTILRQFLGLAPAPERIPGMAAFKKALDRFYQTYNTILGSYQTSAPEERAGLIQDIRTKLQEVQTVANTGGPGGSGIIPPTVPEQLAFQKQIEDAQNKADDLITKIQAMSSAPVPTPPTPVPAPSSIPGMAAFETALAQFNQTHERVLGSYLSAPPADRSNLINQIRTALDKLQRVANTGGPGGSGIIPPTVAGQLAFQKQIEDAENKADDLIAMIQSMGIPSPTPSPFVPGHSDILNREPTNETEAFALLRAYASQPEANFSDFVGVALDLTFQGERERVFNLPTEALKKIRVKKLLDSSGVGPALGPGDDPGGQPGPPPFRSSDPLDPSNLGPGRRNMRRDRF